MSAEYCAPTIPHHERALRTTKQYRALQAWARPVKIFGQMRARHFGCRIRKDKKSEKKSCVRFGSNMDGMVHRTHLAFLRMLIKMTLNFINRFELLSLGLQGHRMRQGATIHCCISTGRGKMSEDGLSQHANPLMRSSQTASMFACAPATMTVPGLGLGQKD